MNRIEIRPVSLPDEAMPFIKVPWRVYAGVERWVPPLIFERKDFLNPAKNPYFKLADVQCFIATRDGEPVGTISAQIDHAFLAKNPGTGLFGFFEFVNDLDIARCLFKAASSWLREKGMTRALGPFNFNANHECGLLVDNFDQDPLVMTVYNPPYYKDVFEALGLAKAHDMYGYWLDAGPMPSRIAAVADRFMDRHPEVTIRPVNMRDYRAEVEIARQLYNDAWDDNWASVQLTSEEFDKVAAGLKPMIDPRLCYVAEVDGKPAAFSLTLPDFNFVVKPMNGRLFPFGWYHFLTRKSKVKQLRIFTLGVHRDYQHLPLGAPLYKRTWEAGLAMGVRGAEASWILESNTRMRGAMEKLGGRIYKTWRIYGADLMA